MAHEKEIFSFEGPVCIFCKTNSDDEILFGTYILKNNIALHYNCLFFASGLKQTLPEKKGILGFKLSDIQNEIKRGSKLKCTFCKKNGATIGCCVSICKKSFHFSCGIKNGAQNQAFGNFASYCSIHSRKQPEVLKPESSTLCSICYENIAGKQMYYYPPCCKNGWFHKYCMQNYAYNSGAYFFKCPWCNDNEVFMNEMKLLGIGIPIKDASWESEANAFEDHIIKPACHAEKCSCPEGRESNSNSIRSWRLLLCKTCGYGATHVRCGRLKVDTDLWMCKDCKEIEAAIKKRKMENTDQVKACNIINLSTFLNDSISTFKYNISGEEFKSTLNDMNNLSLNSYLAAKPSSCFKTICKRSTKKRKLTTHCCDQKQQCITKYFGIECGKFIP